MIVWGWLLVVTGVLAMERVTLEDQVKFHLMTETEGESEESLDSLSDDIPTYAYDVHPQEPHTVHLEHIALPPDPGPILWVRGAVPPSVSTTEKTTLFDEPIGPNPGVRGAVSSRCSPQPPWTLSTCPLHAPESVVLTGNWLRVYNPSTLFSNALSCSVEWESEECGPLKDIRITIAPQSHWNIVLPTCGTDTLRLSFSQLNLTDPFAPLVPCLGQWNAVWTNVFVPGIH